MDQRAPRTAAFASTIATMSLIALLCNAFLGKYPGQEGQRVLLKPLFTGFLSGTEKDYWASTGWGQQEWIWLIITICLALIVVWCRQERPVPELPVRRSVEEQIADFESTSTSVGSVQSASVTQNTSNIISSIIGETTTVDTQKVQSATVLLSSGTLGSYAASVVSERNTDIESSGHLNPNTYRRRKKRLQYKTEILLLMGQHSFHFLVKRIKGKKRNFYEIHQQNSYRIILLTFPFLTCQNWMMKFPNLFQRCQFWTICLRLQMSQKCRIWMTCFEIKERGSKQLERRLT